MAGPGSKWLRPLALGRRRSHRGRPNENERHTLALMRIRVSRSKPLIAGIRTSAITHHVSFVDRPQELLGQHKCMDDVPIRPQRLVHRGTDGCVIESSDSIIPNRKDNDRPLIQRSGIRPLGLRTKIPRVSAIPIKSAKDLANPSPAGRPETTCQLLIRRCQFCIPRVVV
jgi:hypothetical protein